MAGPPPEVARKVAVAGEWPMGPASLLGPLVDEAAKGTPGPLGVKVAKKSFAIERTGRSGPSMVRCTLILWILHPSMRRSRALRAYLRNAKGAVSLLLLANDEPHAEGPALREDAFATVGSDLAWPVTLSSSLTPERTERAVMMFCQALVAAHDGEAG